MATATKTRKVARWIQTRNPSGKMEYGYPEGSTVAVARIVFDKSGKTGKLFTGEPRNWKMTARGAIGNLKAKVSVE